MKTCSWCGHEMLEPGFMMDTGQAARGYGSWVRGHLEIGPILGSAKLFGKDKLAVHAFRCSRCSHLELFAPEDE